MSSLLRCMSSCARVIHQEGKGHFLIGRHALFWNGKVACGNRKISFEEQFAPCKNRLLIYTVPHNCHGKSKSLTAKANHSQQEQTREASTV